MPSVDAAFSKIWKKKTALIVFFCVVCSEGVLKYMDDAMGTFKNDSGKQLVRAGKMIDENTTPDDTIISIGFNG